MMEEAVGKFEIVAEDLGTLTPDVTELMEQTGLTLQKKFDPESYVD